MEVLLFSLLAIVVGLGLVFVGYAAFRILLPILGFFAGFWIGLDVVSSFSLSYPFLGLSLGFVLGIVFGIILAAIAYFVYSLAIVFAGVALGYALGAGAMLALGLGQFMTFIVGIVGAVGVGYLFIRGNMPKVYIMVITAFAGASALIGGLLALFGQIPPSQLGLAMLDSYIGQSYFWIAVWVIVAGLGVAFQYQTAKASEAMIPTAYSFDETVKDYDKKAKAQKS